MCVPVLSFHCSFSKRDHVKGRFPLACSFLLPIQEKSLQEPYNDWLESKRGAGSPGPWSTFGGKDAYLDQALDGNEETRHLWTSLVDLNFPLKGLFVLQECPHLVSTGKFSPKSWGRFAMWPIRGHLAVTHGFRTYIVILWDIYRSGWGTIRRNEE